ncbi:MAG: 3-phosphoshikimate 1-carboxyvinyltransferase [Candidatus Eisenbacteria bacterium]|nr:3-phosphoshikimate 1-carboxyvinyltransferase [Candidatus Eisenbacteria bacterium]
MRPTPATPAPLTTHPGPPLAGRVRPPGDKSVTHRAILLGLIAEGETRVEGANPGADCAATLACAGALGAGVTRDGGAVVIRGTAGRLAEPAAVLDCGNSGTTLRLLAGVLAGRPVLAVLAGDASLNRRPVGRVVEPLRRMGAELYARDGDRLPPLVVRGRALAAIRYELPMASAQVASCVLLAGLAAAGETAVELPGPARDHTERMLPAFGVEVTVEPRAGAGPRLALRGPATPRATRLTVPGDFSAAAFFLAAAAARPGATVTAEGVSLNPTRTGLLDVLERMGARIERANQRLEAGEPVGDVTLTGPDRLEAFDVPAAWVPRLLDEVPAWVIAATAARGTSRLAGAAELRVKESDRLAALAANLAALGVRVEESPDSLAVTGGRVSGGTVAAGDDHRVAMAFAVLGTCAQAPVTVDDASSIPTSYPGFVAALAALGGRVEEGPGPGSAAGRRPAGNPAGTP